MCVHSVLILHLANTKIAQLEADKTFLEGELKSRRGGRRSLAPRLPTNHSDHSQSSTKTSDPSTEPQSDSYDRMDTECAGLTDSNEELRTRSSGEQLKQQQPERVINLLEELETEFSRQKSAKGTTVKLSSGRDTENTVPSRKVIQVSNKNAEQCAQQ